MQRVARLYQLFYLRIAHRLSVASYEAHCIKNSLPIVVNNDEMYYL